MVIPCFNLAVYLPEAVESALGQSHGNTEVIIVDDGSTDNTAAVAERYRDRVVYHHQANRGLPAARNAGLAMAGGDYVVFLDADDVLEPAYLARALDALQRAGAGCAYVYTQVRYFGLRDGVSSFPEFDVEALKSKNFVHASALLRTDVIRRFPFCEGLRRGWEDWDLYLTLAEHGHRGALLDEPLLRYRQREGSMLTDLAHGEQRLRLQATIMRRHIGLYGLRRYASLTALRARHGVARRVRHLRPGWKADRG